MTQRIPPVPRGLALLAVVGPSLIWCAEYIGSGEVILATRTGAVLGTAALWAVIVAIILKYCIGLAGARWTAITGEGMIDLFDRIPGPRHWLIWLVLAVQFPAAIVSIGALSNVAGVFLNSLLPLPAEEVDHIFGFLIPRFLLPLPAGEVVWGITASLFAVCVAWSGRFDLLKMVMSGLIMVIVVGVLYVAFVTMPPFNQIGRGLVGLSPLQIPTWASQAGKISSPWSEILPMMGWAAGGFASQVWYSYWVLGAGYGSAKGRGWGKPADLEMLASLTQQETQQIRGWCRVVRIDASVALIIGIIVTIGFMLAGAGILRPAQLIPQGSQVALTLSRIFSDQWGRFGGLLFLLAGSAAMVSTLVGQLSGWPRLLADCVRIVYPPFARLPWKLQFHSFLTLFVITNLVGI
ncbi:MAG: Nramp family divalent metal transporter, partial [Planctomycetota bacterium]